MATKSSIMKVAHIAVVTPHRAGLYETTRDLVAAERQAGIDARIIDPVNHITTVDRDVPVVDQSFASQCQVIISHSGLSKELNKTSLPIIHVLHGRPHSSFLLEQAGKIPVYTYLKRIATDPRFKRFVTFWPSFIPYWTAILPQDRVCAITAPVDLEHWTPNGPSGYQFHGHKGQINVVCASLWREDETPYHILHAFLLFARTTPGAKLHIYAAPQKGAAWAVLKSLLKEAGALGEVAGFVEGLDNVYRAADVAITPHRIATRSVREPLACGCNVVMAPGNQYTPFQADPQNLPAYAAQITRAVTEQACPCPQPCRRVHRQAQNRKTAKLFFNPEDTATEFIALIREVAHGNH